MSNINCPELEKSLGMTTEVSPSDPRSKYMGKIVRYKNWHPRLGMIARDYDFKIEMIQNSHDGKPLLRGVAWDREKNKQYNPNDFGHPISMDEVEIIENYDSKIASEEVNTLIKEHVKSGGGDCLMCKKGNIEGGSIGISAGKACQSIHCLDCGAEWTEIYTLSGVEFNS